MRIGKRGRGHQEGRANQRLALGTAQGFYHDGTSASHERLLFPDHHVNSSQTTTACNLPPQQCLKKPDCQVRLTSGDRKCAIIISCFAVGNPIDAELASSDNSPTPVIKAPEDVTTVVTENNSKEHLADTPGKSGDKQHFLATDVLAVCFEAETTADTNRTDVIKLSDVTALSMPNDGKSSPSPVDSIS